VFYSYEIYNINKYNGIFERQAQIEDKKQSLGRSDGVLRLNFPKRDPNPG